MAKVMPAEAWMFDEPCPDWPGSSWSRGALTRRFGPPVVEEEGAVSGCGGAPDTLRVRFPLREA